MFLAQCRRLSRGGFEPRCLWDIAGSAGLATAVEPMTAADLATAAPTPASPSPVPPHRQAGRSKSSTAGFQSRDNGSGRLTSLVQLIVLEQDGHYVYIKRIWFGNEVLGIAADNEMASNSTDGKIQPSAAGSYCFE